MTFTDFLKRTFTWWNSQTFGTQLWTRRNGTKVGEDHLGNVYYRNADDSRRWVIFNGEAEASRVPTEWFGWLHRTWNETPQERQPVRRPVDGVRPDRTDKLMTRASGGGH